MVLRNGEKVGIRNAHETNADEIVSMITGAKVVEKV
jgi:ABC-type sugar transport system ATPase subunit